MFEIYEDDVARFYLYVQVAIFMKTCSGYNAYYCDTSMCFECQFCDKNLKIEYGKLENLCIKCHGYALTDHYLNENIIATKCCNFCGGSGRFIK